MDIQARAAWWEQVLGLDAYERMAGGHRREDGRSGSLAAPRAEGRPDRPEPVEVGDPSAS